MRIGKEHFGIHLCALALMLLCSASAVGAYTLPKTAKLVPPETIVLIDIDNFQQLRTQFEKTNLYKLYKDPAMAAFFNTCKTKWREKKNILDSEIADAIVDANMLPQGRTAVALIFGSQPAVETDELITLFITQWGENISKIKDAVNKAAKKAVENGSHQKAEDYRGISIKTIISANPSSPADEQSSPISYFFIEDCLIASENIEALKFFIAHIKGAASPTLADDTDYASTFTSLGPYHDINVYINIRQTVKTIITKDTTGTVKTTITYLGLDNTASAGCSIGVGREPGSSYRGKVFLKVNGIKKGVLKILDTKSASLDTPRFISSSSHSVTFLNLDIKKAYDEIYNVIYSFDPLAALVMQKPLLPPGPNGEPALGLKADIIDHLGSQIIIAQNINKPFSAGRTTTESLIAFAVNDRKALEKSLSLLHSRKMAPNNPDASRKFLGQTIYLITPSAFLSPDSETKIDEQPIGPVIAQKPPRMAFTVTDTHLIFGIESTVEKAVRNMSSPGSASVASAGWFITAKSAIPSVAGIASLQDDAASFELLWWMLKQKGKMNPTGVIPAPNPGIALSQAGGDMFNFALLPEFDSVRKYFGLSVLYGISRADGFFFEFKDINPQTPK